MKFCIVLRSKFTGEEIHLGSVYKTADEAKSYALNNLCAKCNYFDIRGVHDSYVYANRREGFVPSSLAE
jgi:hypothetical protein